MLEILWNEPVRFKEFFEMIRDVWKAVAAVYVPGICARQLPQFKHLVQHLIVRVKIPTDAIVEANVKILVTIFFVERQPSLELYFQEFLCPEVLRNEICPIPIVGKSNRSDNQNRQEPPKPFESCRSLAGVHLGLGS